MINFAVKVISDAGFQHEISNITTAAQQVNFKFSFFFRKNSYFLISYIYSPKLSKIVAS